MTVDSTESYSSAVLMLRKFSSVHSIMLRSYLSEAKIAANNNNLS